MVISFHIYMTLHDHPSPSWQVRFMDSLALRIWEMDSMSSWMCLHEESALGCSGRWCPQAALVSAVTDGYWGFRCGQVVLQWWSSKLPWQTESILCKRTGWTTPKSVGTTHADYTRLVFSQTRARQMQRALLGRKKRIYFLCTLRISQKVAIVIARCTSGNINQSIYHLVIWHSHGKSPFLIGKPSINGQFSMAMLNNQRVYTNVFFWVVRLPWWTLG